MLYNKFQDFIKQFKVDMGRNFFFSLSFLQEKSFNLISRFLCQYFAWHCRHVTSFSFYTIQPSCLLFLSTSYLCFCNLLHLSFQTKLLCSSGNLVTAWGCIQDSKISWLNWTKLEPKINHSHWTRRLFSESTPLFVWSWQPNTMLAIISYMYTNLNYRYLGKWLENAGKHSDGPIIYMSSCERNN